jgi:thiol-disulfide isomerase/thioredoxin
MKYLILLLFAAFLSSCEPPDTYGIGKILETPRNSELPFPVYREFKEIEQLFKQRNDTTYVINFWATWCAPCVEELPLFERLAEEYADKPLKIVLLSLDLARDVEGKLVDFIDKNKVSSSVIVLLDQKLLEWKAKVDKRWGGQVPMTIIYKRDLRIIAREQFSTYFDLEEKVTPLLGK